MSHSQKVKVTGLLFLAIMTIGMFALTPLGAFWLHLGGKNADAASSLPYHEFADGPYHVQGNTIVGADGKPYLFHGVGRDSLEFDCNGDGFLDAAHLTFIGPGNDSGGTNWYANTVRLPVSEGFWLHGNAAQLNCTPANYQALVKNTINTLTALKLNVILDLQWTDAGGQNTGSGAGYEMPDADSITFWSQAAKVYASYSNVLFELYNEPHPPTFACWAAPTCAITNDTTAGGNVSYTGVSIQSLVNAVRGAGANNLALVAGINWGFDLSQLSSYPITGSNIVYDSHPYPYGGKDTTAEWDAAFGYLTSKYPVMSAEFGEYDGNSSFESMAVNYFDQHMMGWTAWAWYNTGGSAISKTGYPQLVSDYNGTPLASMGTYIYQQLLNYAGVKPPTPTPTQSPVSKVWYFAEGRVGAG
ncbi:MAG TPA: cellulase family glycosylhydrolase, partial [Ktedonobacteraceae bacterium]|nr:cellulase family glycosylhydrolase [Ktedonobacteraceae bacterium]